MVVSGHDFFACQMKHFRFVLLFLALSLVLGVLPQGGLPMAVADVVLEEEDNRCEKEYTVERRVGRGYTSPDTIAALSSEEDPGQVSPDDLPVVLIHGKGGYMSEIWGGVVKWNVADWVPASPGTATFAQEVASLDGVVAYRFDYKDDEEWVDHDNVGGLFKDAIDCLYEVYGQQVVVVAHSLGGLVAQQVAKWDSDADTQKIGLVVSFGTPYEGSEIAAAIIDDLSNPLECFFFWNWIECGKEAGAAVFGGLLTNAGLGLRAGSKAISELSGGEWQEQKDDGKKVKLVGAQWQAPFFAIGTQITFFFSILGFFRVSLGFDNLGDYIVHFESATGGEATRQADQHREPSCLPVYDTQESKVRWGNRRLGEIDIDAEASIEMIVDLSQQVSRGAYIYDVINRYVPIADSPCYHSNLPNTDTLRKAALDRIIRYRDENRAPPLPEQECDLEVTINDMTLGDLYKTGREDIVVAGEQGIKTYRNDGQGGYGEGTILTCAVTNINSIAVGDINDDSLPDIVVARTSQPASINSPTTKREVLLLQAKRLSIAGHTQTVTYPDKPQPLKTITTNHPISLAIGDLPGTKHPDLLIGTLGQIERYNHPTNTWTTIATGLGNGRVSIAIGDLNGDQHNDIAAVTPTQLWAILSAGNGNFDEPIPIGHTPNTTGKLQIAVADLNADQAADIITADQDRTTIHITNPAFFTNPTNQPQPAPLHLTTPGNPYDLAVGNITGDPHPDIVTIQRNPYALHIYRSENRNNQQGLCTTRTKRLPNATAAAIPKNTTNTIITTNTTTHETHQPNPCQTHHPLPTITPPPEQPTVRMGINPCCADTSFWQIPIEKGWFDEIGIKIEPEVVRTNVMAFLRGERLHVATAWVPSLFGHLETFGQSLPPVLFSDVFNGYKILVAPNSEAKTALEFMNEGMSFSDAAEEAVKQLLGKDIHIPPHSTVQTQYANAFFAYLDEWQGDDDDWRYYARPRYVDDNIIVELSAAGRVEFAMPYSSLALVQMMRNGWEPLISFGMMRKHDPSSYQTAIANATTGGVGLLANREWAQQHRDTLYRLLSVGFRTLAYLEDPDTQAEGWAIQTNFINTSQALSLEAVDIGLFWEVINPSFTWEDQEALWDTNLPSYHPETAFAEQIETLKAGGVLSSGFDTKAGLARLLLAQDLYYEMRGMQIRSDQLFAQAADMELTDEQTSLVQKARTFYQRYNFLDALRTLQKALS